MSREGNYLYTLCQWANSGIAIFSVDHAAENLILIDSILSDIYGSTGIDEPIDLEFSPDGRHLYVVSSHNQPGLAWVEVTNQLGCRNSDTLQITLHTNHVFIGQAEIKVGPNPTLDFVKIESNYIITTTNCYNIRGKLLLSIHPNSNTGIIKSKALSRGVYLLRITLIDEQTQAFRIIKM